MKIIFADKSELDILGYRLINDYLEIKVIDLPYDIVIGEYFVEAKCIEITINNDYFSGYTNRIFTLQDTYMDVSRVKHSRITIRMQLVDSVMTLNEIQQKVVALQEEKVKLATSIEETNNKISEVKKQLEPVIKIESLSLSEYRDYKIHELGTVCTENIYKGLDVTTSKGSEHFTYNLEDQYNLKVLSDTAILTKSDLPYHTNGQQCKVYSAKDIITIYATLQRNLLYHTTYCNALNTLVRQAESKEDIQIISYGMEITDTTIKAKMSEALNAGYAAMDLIITNNTMTEEIEKG